MPSVLKEPSQQQYIHRFPHGKRKETEFIEFMEEHLGQEDLPLRPYLLQFYREQKVHPSVTRRWWNHYLHWGESPTETKEKTKKYHQSTIITQDVVSTLKNIVDESPEFYLDEIAAELVVCKNLHLSLPTIARTLKYKVGYSLQVCYESAKQRDELERTLYKEALNLLVQSVDQLIFIDETHKDRNTARRRRAWGKRNSGGLAIKRWFRQQVRYTLIAAMDIDGFLPSTLEIVRQNELSNKGAAGTVDSDHFERWTENYLLPVLGNYENGEPRSIVVMDNASTHLGERVKNLIKSKGAYLLFTAPYLPDLNPIELGFHVYKKELKRNYELGAVSWYETHVNAIDSINRDTCIKEFRKCGVPMSKTLETTEEKNEREKNELNLLTSLSILL